MKKYIISNEIDVNEQNVGDWINDFISNIQPHLCYLEAFYQGKDEIVKYPFEQKRINNIVHVNHAYMTVQNIISYCFGKIPTQDYKKEFEYGKYIDELKFRNNEILEDKALESDLSRLGIAYEFIGVREYKGKKEPFYKKLDPFTTFLVTDDSILETEICYITYSIVKPKNAQPFKRGFIYTKGEIISFDCKSGKVVFTEREDNTAYPNDFPIVLYKNNDDAVGDYEMATEILSQISKTVSGGADDFESVANAMLLIYNADLPDEEREKLNKTRVAALNGENTKAEYIYKKLDSTSFKVLYEALVDRYYAITNIPDFTDLCSYNKSGSAIAFKMIGIENVRLNKTAYFEQGMRKRWDIIANYVGEPFEIKLGDMEYHFHNNLPSNVTADLEYADLVDRGLLSRETAMKHMETVTDVEGELARIQAEKQADMQYAIAEIRKADNNTNGTEYREPSFEFSM